jgi:hypothetical protein
MALFSFGGTDPQSYVAGGAILPYRCVKLDTVTGQVVATTTVADVIVGTNYLGNTLAAGDQIAVQIGGEAKMVAGGAIALGAQVVPMAAGAGRVVTAVGAGATAVSCGVALQAAAADGDVIRVRIVAPNVAGPANA